MSDIGPQEKLPISVVTKEMIVNQPVVAFPSESLGTYNKRLTTPMSIEEPEAPSYFNGTSNNVHIENAAVADALVAVYPDLFKVVEFADKSGALVVSEPDEAKHRVVLSPNGIFAVGEVPEWNSVDPKKLAEKLTKLPYARDFLEASHKTGYLIEMKDVAKPELPEGSGSFAAYISEANIRRSEEILKKMVEGSKPNELSPAFPFLPRENSHSGWDRVDHKYYFQKLYPDKFSSIQDGVNMVRRLVSAPQRP